MSRHTVVVEDKMERLEEEDFVWLAAVADSIHPQSLENRVVPFCSISFHFVPSIPGERPGMISTSEEREVVMKSGHTVREVV